MLYKKIISLGIALSLQSFLVKADDTEIYFNTNNPNAADPLVMLTLDWRPNLGSSTCTDYTSTTCQDSVGAIIYPALKANIEEFGLAYRDLNNDGFIIAADGDEVGVEPFDLVRAVLRTILEDPDIYGLRVGLMLSHDDTCTGNSTTGCSNGAYVLKGFTQLNQSDFSGTVIDKTSDRYALLEKLGRIPAPQGNVSHPYQLREIYYEFIKYLTGGRVYQGHLGYEDFASTLDNKNLDDSTNTYKSNPSGPTLTDTRAFAWDATIETRISGEDFYNSPYDSTDDWSCSKTFIINTYFEDNQQADADTDISNAFSSFSLSGGDSNKNEQLISYLNTTDMANGQTITDHTGDAYTAPSVDGEQTVQSYFITAKANTNSADDYAFEGGTGRAFKMDDPTQLLEDLTNIFRDVLSVSTTFVAASVPVNVFNRTEVVDNVYFALFKAEADPLWNGNLKKLKIAEKTGTDGETYYDIVSAEGAGDNSAISPIDGRIRHEALSFWTQSDGYDVVATTEDEEVPGRDGRSITRGGAGQLIPGFLSAASNGAPGDPGFTNGSGNRRLFTETISGFDTLASTPTSSSTLLALNADATTASTLKNRLGVHSDAEAETMLQWLRGFEVDDPAYDASSNKILRSWLLGDPIHSRPIAVNYGTQTGYSEDNPNLRIFMGSNDGFIRAFKDSATGGNATGEELFAFMPNELLLNSEQLRLNASGDHPYGVDGAPTAMVLDQDNDGTIETADGDKVYVYFGLRRGGRAYYALDVSSPSDNVTPTLAWKVKKPVTVTGSNGEVAGSTNRFQTNQTLTPGQLAGGRLHINNGTHATPSANDDFYYIIDNDADSIYVRDDDDGSGGATPEFVNPDTNIAFTAEAYGDSDFSEMGLTFSPPVMGLVKFGSTPTPVVIFGGGYDPDKDDLGAGNDDEGNAIYIVNAETGALVWKAVGGTGGSSDTTYYVSDMVDSIPAQVTPLDSNGDGIIDRLYVGDTGGAVWRVDLPAGDSSGWRSGNWFVTKLAELGTDGAPNDRRFFHGADVVITKDTDGRYDGVIINSGNRASPKRTDVDNYLFMIKDRYTQSGDSNVFSRTPLTINDLTDITNICVSGSETSCASADLENGWKLALTETGEKALATPITAQGTIFFTTYLPEGGSAAGSCAPSEGSGRIYAVKLADGSRASDILGDLDANDDCIRCTDAGAGIPPGATPLGSDNILLPGKGVGGRQIVGLDGKSRWKTYWREMGIDKN